MKKWPLTAILLPGLFMSSIAQKLPEKDKSHDIHTTLAGPGKAPAIRVYNNYSSRGLSNITLKWELLVNGNPGLKGTIAELPVAARQFKDFRLPVKIPAAPGDEVFLNIRYILKKPELPLPAGHMVAQEQLLLKNAKAEALTVTPAGELIFRDEDGIFSVSSSTTGISLQFSKQTGWLQRYMLKDLPLLDDTLGLKANFWRVLADSDDASGLTGQSMAWKLATKEPHLQLFSTSTSSELVIVRADYTLPEVACLLHVHYTINAKGEMLVDQVMEVDTTATPAASKDTARSLAGSPVLPCFGMQWIFPAGYDSIAWYGLGPQENNTGGTSPVQTAIYRHTIQEANTSTAVRWWKVMDRQGKGLLFTADSSLLSMRALHFVDSDRKPHSQTQLDIDYRQLGGGALPYGNYRFMYKISPVP